MKKREPSIAFLTEQLEFPPVERANSEGLLAVGGDLSPERLKLAYDNGIFPWFNEDSLILWWSPNPRMVLFPDKIRTSKSMRKVMKSGEFQFTENTKFKEVLDTCSRIKRKGQRGTWITEAMRKAYYQLHEQGLAKSYEVWSNNELVGGLYGIDLGHIFCGESMFSLKSNASKFGLICLANRLKALQYSLIDCQLFTPHLASMGAEEIPRRQFMDILGAKGSTKSTS